jgi:glycosyltransferase involved in cell wall biosynthesis
MGVDVARFEGGQRQRLRAELGDARHLLLHVGRLVANKGTDDLIRAFAALDVTLRNETRLWIVGSGDREAGLRALSRELGVSDGVRFWGSVANARLPDFYAAADLLLAPSVVSESGESEGQSVVILEAFAARLPVLATDVGGIGEAVQHGTTGWLVPPRQPYLLARAIGQLLSDGELRTFLARNAASAVAERYDWTVIAAQFEDLYRTLRVSDASRLRRRVAKSTGRECP